MRDHRRCALGPDLVNDRAKITDAARQPIDLGRCRLVTGPQEAVGRGQLWALALSPYRCSEKIFLHSSALRSRICALRLARCSVVEVHAYQIRIAFNPSHNPIILRICKYCRGERTKNASLDARTVRGVRLSNATAPCFLSKTVAAPHRRRGEVALTRARGLFHWNMS